MTQVSKRVVGTEIINKVDVTFWLAVAKITKEEDANEFFTDFFSRTERINFTKRLAIAVLLNRGHDWRAVADLLKVSLATVGKVAAKVNGNGYQIMLKKLEEVEEWRNFWTDLGKTYIGITHPERYAKLGEEGVEKVYLESKKTL